MSAIGTQDLPDALKDLYLAAEVNNSNDAFAILLHTFMLEVGFFPKDIHKSEKLKLMPKDWCKKELYSIVYSHPSCPEVCCSVTCFPLYKQLSVFGTAFGMHPAQASLNICFQVSRFINNDNIRSSDLSKIFSNVKELSQSFKDGIAYPLLAIMQDVLGIGPTFGFTVASDYVKLRILSYLPVGGLVAMSCVNSAFNELCNSSSLWKKLFQKDFPKDVCDSDEANKDWKKAYKAKYLRKKQRSQPIILGRPTLHGTVNEFHPPYRIPPELAPDFPFGPYGLRTFPDLQPEARPHNVIRPPPFPHNPLLNIPSSFFWL